MQYHYVVMYDSRTEQWQVDLDTAYGVFNNGYFYDEEQHDWLDPDDKDLETHQEIYLAVENELAAILAPHNLENE